MNLGNNSFISHSNFAKWLKPEKHSWYLLLALYLIVLVLPPMLLLILSLLELLQINLLLLGTIGVLSAFLLILPISLTISRLRYDSKAIDKTVRVHIEDTLVQSEKMLALGGLAAGMAHEINNPLGAILQSCQNVQRRLFGDLPRNRELLQQLDLDGDAVQQYLQQQNINSFVDDIASSGERAAEIVKDMLSFSRPAKGKGTEVDLLTSLEAALRLADHEFSHDNGSNFRRIKIHKDYTDAPLTVLARENQLQQVFLNMLLNAAQAMASHTTSVTPEIKIMLSQQGMMAKIVFCDNGPGIVEAEIKRIFEPFYSTKENGEGTGLGLSISYFIVAEQLAGTLDVESTAGEGSCFIIQLPLHDAASLATVEASRKQINLPF